MEKLEQRAGQIEVVQLTPEVETVKDENESDKAPYPKIRSTAIDKDSLLTRVLWTCVVFYAHACMALMIGALGPAFLDLLYLLDVTIQQGSLLFTSQAIGGMVGGVASAWCYTKFSNKNVITISLLFCACLNALLPFCPNLWLMCVVVALRGLGIYLSFTGCALICIESWRNHEGSPIMQALHCAYSAGGVIAPFIMSNFLTEENEQSHRDQAEFTRNMTTEGGHLVSTLAPEPQSRVYIGFLLISLVTLINFAFSLLMVFYSRQSSEKSVNESVAQKAEKKYVAKEEDNLPIPIKVALIGFITVYFIVIVDAETLMQNYLATFVIRYLTWTKAQGAQITSAFWGSFAAGRFFGIFTAKVLSPWRIIALDFVLLTAATLILTFAVNAHALVIWFCVCGSGLFISGLYGAGCSYVDEEIMNITGKIYPIFLVSEAAGSMIYPVILGYLIDNVSPFWFVYLAVILCILCDFDLLCLTLMVTKWGKRRRLQTKSVEMQNVEERSSLTSLHAGMLDQGSDR